MRVTRRRLRIGTHRAVGFPRRRYLELYSALDADKQLGKLLGFIVDKLELSPGSDWLDELRGLDGPELARASCAAGIEPGDVPALPAAGGVLGVEPVDVEPAAAGEVPAIQLAEGAALAEAGAVNLPAGERPGEPYEPHSGAQAAQGEPI